MSNHFKFSIPAHPSLYQPHDRDLTLYLTQPEKGAQSNTGIMLCISGYGEHAGTSIWEHARKCIADRYNVVVVQCDYFGNRFMQGIQNPKFLFDMEKLSQVFTGEELNEIQQDSAILVDKLLEVGSKYHLHIQGKEELGETLSNFNDMSIMQTVDNLAAVFACHSILVDNGLKVDLNRIVVYGQGHGAYLSHLCNAFAPDLFALLLDCQSSLYPMYLDGDRTLNGKRGNLTFSVVFHYLARTLQHDRELLILPNLYKKFTNKCDIFSSHIEQEGNNYEAIQSFYRTIPNCTFIGRKSLLNHAVTTEPTHTPENTLMELFDSVLLTYTPKQSRSSALSLPTTRLQTKENRYVIDYSSGMPVFSKRPRAEALNVRSSQLLQ